MKNFFAFDKFVVLALATSFLTFGASELRADTWEQIQENKKIVIGTEARFPPFEFVEGGKIVGFTQDVLDAIMAEKPEINVERLDLPFQGLLAGLDARKYDYVVTAVMGTKQRAEQYALSLPIADGTVALLKRKGDSAYNKLEDLAGKTIGVQAGATQTKIVRAHVDALRAQGATWDVKLQEYIDYNEAYSDLTAGRIDAVANSLPNLLFLAKERSELFEVITDPVGPRIYYGWAGRKDEDSASLVQFINDGIARLNKSGKLGELQAKWFGYAMEVPSEKVPDPEF